jgi:hypothetical protein
MARSTLKNLAQKPTKDYTKPVKVTKNMEGVSLWINEKPLP